MKKKTSILLFGILIISSFYLSISNKKTVKELTFSNIEALAQNEGSYKLCIGSGSLDCNGDKVKMIFDNFSIK